MTNRERNKERYEKRKEAGLCGRCGKAKERSYLAHCDTCLEKLDTFKKWSRIKKLVLGLLKEVS